MNKPETMKLLARIEIEYDIVLEQDRVDRWVEAMRDQDADIINHAFDFWVYSDYGHRAPSPANLKRCIQITASAYERTGDNPGPGLKSGASEQGIVIQEHTGVYHLIPRSKVRNINVDALKEAMIREGTI